MNVAKYRKKSPVVEAIQYKTGDEHELTTYLATQGGTVRITPYSASPLETPYIYYKDAAGSTFAIRDSDWVGVTEDGSSIFVYPDSAFREKFEPAQKEN